MQLWKLFELICCENFALQRAKRITEPNALMNDLDNVHAFHTAGNEYLIPIYHFNAVMISRQVKQNGVILDLGSGSGKFLAHLNKIRPDLEIYGLELAPEMVKEGNQFLQSIKANHRVKILTGDMTNFFDKIECKPDLISSVFSLHHLPSELDLKKCFEQIHLFDSNKCSVWIFDHIRPRNKLTAEKFPDVFTPKASTIFNKDSENSLKASFTFEDLTLALDGFNVNWSHCFSSWLKVYQIHWRSSINQLGALPISNNFEELLNKEDQAQFKKLMKLFRKLP